MDLSRVNFRTIGRALIWTLTVMDENRDRPKPNPSIRRCLVLIYARSENVPVCLRFSLTVPSLYIYDPATLDARSFQTTRALQTDPL